MAGVALPGGDTIDQLIADARGLRTVPPRLNHRGRRKHPRLPKPRKPKGFQARRPGGILAAATVIAVRDGRPTRPQGDDDTIRSVLSGPAQPLPNAGERTLVAVRHRRKF